MFTNNADRRTEALRILAKETTMGADDDVRTRDRAYHTLMNTSTTNDEWKQVASLICEAQHYDDLREGVSAKFFEKCPDVDLVHRALSGKLEEFGLAKAPKQCAPVTMEDALR